MSPDKRKARISSKDLVIGLVVAALFLLGEMLLLHEHLTTRAITIRLIEPVIAAVLVGVSWPAARAFFLSVAKTIAFLVFVFIPVGAVTAIVGFLITGDTAIAAVAAVALAVATVFSIAVILFIWAWRHAADSIISEEFFTSDWGVD
jgi:hypothetical protein